LKLPSLDWRLNTLLHRTITGVPQVGEDLDSLVGNAVVQQLKQQAIQEFLEKNEFTCPECGHTLANLPQSTTNTTTVTEEETHPDDIDSEELEEAKQLLAKVTSWSEKEIEELPDELQQRARQYKQMLEY